MKRVLDFLIQFFKNKKYIVITVSVLAAAALIITGYLVFYPHKSPRELYLASEGKNFRKYSEQLKAAYEDFYTSQEPYMNGLNKRRLEIGPVDIASDSDQPFGIPNAKNIFEIIEKCKLIIDTRNDPAGKQNMVNASLLLEKAPLIDLTAFKKDRQLTFTVPVFTPDRYFTLNMDKMDEVYDRFGIPVKPKRIINKTGIAGAIRFDAQGFDQEIKDYGAFISSLITDQDVRYGEDVSLKIGGEDRKGREIIVSLGSDKTKALIGKLADKAAGDDLLLQLTYGNFADVAKLFDEAGLFQLFDFLEDTGFLVLNDTWKQMLEALNVKKDLEGFTKALRELGTEMSYPEGVTMKVVVDGAGNILDRNFSISYINKNGTTKSIEVHSGKTAVKEDNFNHSFVTLQLLENGSDGKKSEQTFTLSTNITPPSGTEGKKGRIEAGYEKSMDGAVLSGISAGFDLDNKTDELTRKDNSTVKYAIEIRGATDKMKDRISGELASTASRNNKLKTRNISGSITVNLQMPSFGLENTGLKLNYTLEDRFEIEKFSLPEVQAAGIVDLNTVTDEKLKEVEKEITASFGTFYLNNKPLVDAINGGSR